MALRGRLPQPAIKGDSITDPEAPPTSPSGTSPSSAKIYPEWHHTPGISCAPHLPHRDTCHARRPLTRASRAPGRRVPQGLPLLQGFPQDPQGWEREGRPMRLPRGSRAPLPRRRGDGAGLRARLPGGARALPRGDETRKSLNDEPPWRRKARQGPGRGPLTANTGIHAAPRAITRLTPHPRPHTSHRKRHRRQQPPQAPGRGIMVRKVEDGCTYRCSWTPFSSLVYGAQRHLAAAHATGRGRAKFELSHRPDARAALRSPPFARHLSRNSYGQRLLPGAFYIWDGQRWIHIVFRVDTESIRNYFFNVTWVRFKGLDALFHALFLPVVRYFQPPLYTADTCSQPQQCLFSPSLLRLP